MIIKNSGELVLLKKGGAFLAGILSQVKENVRAGIKTSELDALAERLIIKFGGKPSFKNYKSKGSGASYPASLCVSINDEVVHGIPSDRIIKTGDIVGLDIGMEYEKFFTDMAVTVGVGEINSERKKLIDVTQKALEIGIAVARLNSRVGDIGAAIQKFVESEGFGVVRELVGHGVGAAVHEEPEVPNWGKRGTGVLLVEGMVLALEPMVTLGEPAVKISSDAWTWKTVDGKPAAHFEHTILITKNGAEILTK